MVILINRNNLGRSNQVSNQVNPAKSVNEKKLHLLKYCLKPRSKVDMLKRLGLSNQTVNFRRHIQPLLEQGLIARTIPEEPNHPNQKYITTIAGREMI